MATDLNSTSSIDDKIQQTADNLHIPIYKTQDGKLYQLKPGNTPPPGAKVFHPAKPWPAPFVGTANSNGEIISSYEAFNP